MSWIKWAVKRATGGDQAGLRAAVDGAVLRRDSIDAAQLCDCYCVSRGAVRDAITDRLAEEVRSLAPLGLLSEQKAGLLQYAASSGADIDELDRQIKAAALALVRKEAESQYAGQGISVAALIEGAAMVGLNEDEVRAELESYATRTLERILVDILADEKVCPDEESYLREAMGRLAVGSLGGDADAKVEQAKALWRAAHAELPIVSAPILLQRNEVCHHAIRAEALENRSRTIRVNYGGPSARIRIAKGVYYNIGSTAVSRQTENYQHSFGEGALCATSKRLLWIGVEKTISIKLDSIVHYESFTDGILIRKSTGKPLTFAYADGMDLCSTTLIARVIEEQR
jgi:hypothetical protein